MDEARQVLDEKYKTYAAGLELVQFLEGGNMDGYFAQPTQGMQNSLGDAMGKYAQLSESLYRKAYDESVSDYNFAKWQMAALALALDRGAGVGLVRHSPHSAGPINCRH
jgi:methyl-accepting chemotaxis protein-2 (aspartate sensor receptor)